MVEPIGKSSDELLKLCKLIKKGNAEIDIQESKESKESKAILVVGKTRAGKSTSVYILANKELRAETNKETGEKEISCDLHSNLPNITIGHDLYESETTVPGKWINQGGDDPIVVWDCPGFAHIGNTVQEIANGFYIDKILKTTKMIKFILTIDAASFKSNEIPEILKIFMGMFSDIEVIQDCVSLLITKVPQDRTPTNYKNILEKNTVNSIDKSHETSNQEKEKLKTLIKILTKSIHLIHEPFEPEQPKSENIEPKSEIKVWKYSNVNLLKEIEADTKYSQIDPKKILVSISDRSIKLCKEFFEKSNEELINALKIVANKIIKETGFVNADENVIVEKISVMKPRVFIGSQGEKLKCEFEDKISNKKLLNLNDICKFEQILHVKNPISIETILKNVDDLFDLLIYRSPEGEMESLKKEKDDIHEKINAAIYMQKVCQDLKIQIEEIYQIFDEAGKATKEAAKKGISNFSLESGQQEIYYIVAKSWLDAIEDQQIKSSQLSICDYYLGQFYQSQKNYENALNSYLDALKNNPDPNPADTSIIPIFSYINELLIFNPDFFEKIKTNQRLNQQLFDSKKICFEESIRSLHKFLDEKCKKSANYFKHYDKMESYLKDIQFLNDLKEIYLHFKTLNTMEKISESNEEMNQIFEKIKNVFVQDSVDQNIEEFNKLLIKKINEIRCLLNFNKNMGESKSAIIDEMKNLFTPSLKLSSKTLIDSIQNLKIDKNVSDRSYFDKIIDLCELVEESSAVDLKKAAAYENKGRIWKDDTNPDYEEAIKCYQKSLEFDNTNTQTRIIIAELYYKKGNYQKSAEYFEICSKFHKVKECYKKEIEISKNNIHFVYERYGDYYQEMGMKESAVKKYFNALSFNSEDKNYCEKIWNKIQKPEKKISGAIFEKREKIKNIFAKGPIKTNPRLKI